MANAPSPYYATLTGSSNTLGANGSTAKANIPITFSSSLGTFTGVLSTISPVVTSVSSTTGLWVGQQVSGTGVPAATIITAIGSGQITLSNTPTVNSSETITFSNMPTVGHTLVGAIRMGGGGSLNQSGNAPATSFIVDPRNTWTIDAQSASTGCNVAIVRCVVTNAYTSGDIITVYCTSATYNSFVIIDVKGTLAQDGTPIAAFQTGAHSTDTGGAEMIANAAQDYMVAAIGNANTTGAGVITQTASNWTLRGANGNATQNVAIAELLSPSTTGENQAQWSWTGGTVTDGTAVASYSVTIASDTAPIAVPGSSASIATGTLYTLNGSGSYPTTYGDYITAYAWSMSSRPSGSTAVLSSTTAVNPNFTPDKSGNYVIQLVVTDNRGTQSSPQTVTLTAGTTVRRYWDGSEAIELRVTTLLPDGTFH